MLLAGAGGMTPALALVAGGAGNLFVGVLLSVLPLHAVVPLHHVSVQRLLVLGRVVAALPVARVPDVLAQS